MQTSHSDRRAQCASTSSQWSYSAKAHFCMHPLDGAIMGNNDVKCLVQDLDHHPSLAQLTKHLGEGWEGHVGWGRKGGRGTLGGVGREGVCNDIPLQKLRRRALGWLSGGRQIRGESNGGCCTTCLGASHLCLLCSHFPLVTVGCYGIHFLHGALTLGTHPCTVAGHMVVT